MAPEPATGRLRVTGRDRSVDHRLLDCTLYPSHPRSRCPASSDSDDLVAVEWGAHVRDDPARVEAQHPLFELVDRVGVRKGRGARVGACEIQQPGALVADVTHQAAHGAVTPLSRLVLDGPEVMTDQQRGGGS